MRVAPALRDPEGVVAVRYAVDIRTEYGRDDLAELWLPEAGVSCNLAGTDFVDGELETSANAFAHRNARNFDHANQERPTERVVLPPAVAADIVELARLTEARRALAVRVARELAPLVALDEGYELVQLHLAIRRARERGADGEKLQAIEQRAAAVRMDWTLEVDEAKVFRALREELDALGR